MGPILSPQPRGVLWEKEVCVLGVCGFGSVPHGRPNVDFLRSAGEHDCDLLEREAAGLGDVVFDEVDGVHGERAEDAEGDGERVLERRRGHERHLTDQE